MARELYTFAVTIPALTAIAAPTTTDLTMPARFVRQVVVRIPPGPSGLVGFQLWVKGGQVIPANRGAYLITDDEVLEWDLDGLPESGAWQLVAYNTGANAHTLYVRFITETLDSGLTVPATPAPIAPGLLAPVTAADLESGPQINQGDLRLIAATVGAPALPEPESVE